MSLAKLKKRYRQKAQNLQAVERVKKLRHQLEALPAGGGDTLLELSFEEWCATVEMSTLEGIKPVELFPWQKEFADSNPWRKAINSKNYHAVIVAANWKN